MSTDYKIRVKRKDNDKLLAAFWYNRVKNVGDIYSRDMDLAFDPEKSNYCSDSAIRKLSIDMLDADIEKLKNGTEVIYKDIFEKKMMIMLSQSVKVVEKIEEDIQALKEELSNFEWAYMSLQSLKTVIEVLVQDMSTEDDSDPEFISLDDIYIEFIAYC